MYFANQTNGSGAPHATKLQVFCCTIHKFGPSLIVRALSARPMWLCHANPKPPDSPQHPSQQGQSTSSQSTNTLIPRIVSFLIPLLSPSTQSPEGAAPVKLFKLASKVPEQKVTNRGICMCRQFLFHTDPTTLTRQRVSCVFVQSKQFHHRTPPMVSHNNNIYSPNIERGTSSSGSSPLNVLFVTFRRTAHSRRNKERQETIDRHPCC